MPTLVIYRGDTEERRLDLGEQDIRIGRAAGNDLVLDNDGKSVSRFHAELRRENGGYVLLDLNSQNGVWIDGRRVQREALTAGTAAVIGPYRLVLQGQDTAPHPAAIVGDTAPRPAVATSDTVVGASVRRAREARPPAPRRQQARPAGGAPETTAPGLIGWLLRLPRAVLFGGFFAICLLIIVAGQIVNREDTAAAEPGGGPVAPPTPLPPVVTNADRIAAHLQTARTALAEGRHAGVITEADQILLIDREHAEARELKLKAEEAVRAAATPTALPPAPTDGTVAAPPDTGQPSGVAAVPVVEPPLSVTRRAGESIRAARARAQRLEGQHAAARLAIARADYAEAVRLLTDIVRDEPQFLDAPALLEQAREAEKRAQQQSAAQAATHALAEAKRLEGSGELKAALDAYVRAQSLDPGLAGVVSGLNALKARVRINGEEKFAQAKQYDAVGRVPEASALYRQAADLLPEDHPNHGIALARIAALKAAIR